MLNKGGYFCFVEQADTPLPSEEFCTPINRLEFCSGKSLDGDLGAHVINKLTGGKYSRQNKLLLLTTQDWCASSNK